MVQSSYRADSLIMVQVRMATPLRELRESKGLSQDDLVKLAGVAKGTIVDLELHRRKPYPSTRRKLARALKVRPEAIQFADPAA